MSTKKVMRRFFNWNFEGVFISKIYNMFTKWIIWIHTKKEAMEHWSGRGLGIVALKSINFEIMVLGEYKDYGNELEFFYNLLG